MDFLDNVKSWELCSDGSYVKRSVEEGAQPVRAQQRFIELSQRRAKQADVGRGGRFHILRTPNAEVIEAHGGRRSKHRKKRRYHP